jgi:hypothetical protein
VTAASRSKGEFFFSLGTIGRSTREGRKPSTLLQAARHNRRAIQAELGAGSHIDPERICLNETLAGPSTPAEVVALAQSLMLDAGVVVEKLRKDYTQAIELLFSLSADTEVDTGNYFQRCVDWVGERFGAVNILSADIHRDESVPHCHVLLLPLVGGRMRGSKLITRPELVKLRVSFERDVARGFGLKKPPGRMTGATRGQAARLVLERLESTQDPVTRSALWLTTRRAIEHDPAPYLAALSIELDLVEPARKTRTMAEIFTSPGKGPKVELVSRPAAPSYAGIAIGFASGAITTCRNNDAVAPEIPIGFVIYPEKHRNLSCVGIAPSTPVFQSSPPAESLRIDGAGVEDAAAISEADGAYDGDASAIDPRAGWVVGGPRIGLTHCHGAGAQMRKITDDVLGFTGSSSSDTGVTHPSLLQPNISIFKTGTD